MPTPDTARPARRSVNLSLSSDLIARARAAHLNLSAIAEETIGRALAEVTTKRFHEEIARSVEEYEVYLAEYGSFADAVREAVREMEQTGDA